MKEPKGVTWTADSFSLELSTHSVWSAFTGLIAFLAGGGLALLALGSVLTEQPDAAWLIPVFLIVAFGVVAAVGQRAERDLRATTTLRVDGIGVECNGEQARFEAVQDVRWNGTRLELRFPEGALRIETPRLTSEERQWLGTAIRARWDAFRSRRGEVPEALHALKNAPDLTRT